MNQKELGTSIRSGFRNYALDLESVMPADAPEIENMRLRTTNQLLAWLVRERIHRAKGYLAATSASAQAVANLDDLTKLEIRKFCKFIYEGVSKTTGVLKDFGPLVRKQMDIAEKLQMQPLDLVPLINTVAGDYVNYVKGENNYKNLKFIFEPNAKKIVVTADSMAIKIIIFNLVTNGIHAMQESRVQRLTIWCEQRNDSLEKGVNIYVKDTGKGIPASNRDFIYDEGFTTKEDGNGFGLSDVKQLVTVHKGKIDLLKPGKKGTTFVIFLPYQ